MSLVGTLVRGDDLKGDRQELAHDRYARFIHSPERLMLVLDSKLLVGGDDGRRDWLDGSSTQPLAACATILP